MKIAVDLRQYPVSDTGGTTYAMGLLQNMPSLGTLDYAYVVNEDTADAATAAIGANAAQVVTAPKPPLRPRSNLDLARRLVHDVSPRSQHFVDTLDVDVAHFPGDRITPWKVETPSVISFYGANHFVLPNHVYWRNAQVQKVAKMNVIRSLRSCQAVLVPSIFVKSVLVNHLELDPSTIFVRELISWASGIASEPADEVGPEGLSAEQGFFLFTSSHVSYKNHERLILAHEQLPPDVRIARPLIITGRMPEHLGPILNRQDPAHVRHLGFVDRSTLVWLYRHASAYIHPSLYEAGGSFSMFEAAFSGTAVACSNLGSMSETLPSAMLFDPYDVGSIRDVLQTLAEGEHEDIARSCQKWVESFDRQASVAVAEQAYARAAEG